MNRLRTRLRAGGGLTPVAFAISQLFAANEPGFHGEVYDPNTLLARRNYAKYSGDFSNAAWAKSNVSLGPSDGVGVKLVESATGPIAHWVEQAAVSVAGMGVATVRAKAAERSWILVELGGRFTYFDLANGAIGTESVAANINTITAVADAPGYYDCTVASPELVGDIARVYVCNGNGGFSYTGDGTSGLYLARYQGERNTLTPTAYQAVTDWNTEYMAAALAQIGMWQDNLGTQPVTAVEQTVGLWVDSKQGITRGPELVTLSALSAAANWSYDGSKWNLAASVDNGQSLTFTGLTAGQWYELVITVDALNTGSLSFRHPNASTAFGPTISAPGTYRAIFLASGANVYLRNSAVGQDATVSGYSVKTLAGNHATQATGNSRPVLSARYNAFTKSEQINEWTLSATTVIANSFGRLDKVVPSAASTIHYVQSPALSSSAAYVLKFKAKAAEYSWLRLDVGNNTLSVDAATGAYTAGAGAPVISSEIDGDGVRTFTVAGTASLAGVQVFVSVNQSDDVTSQSYAGDGVGGILIGDFDLRATADAALDQPAYQRVNTPADYDTAGFVHYPLFDGGDDYLTAATGGGGSAGFLFCAAVCPSTAGTSRVLWSDRGTNTGYRVMLNSSNQVEISAGNGTAFTAIATAGTLPAGETHIVTAWDDGTNLCVQIDNGAVATIARPAVVGGTAGFTIARTNGASSGYYGGRMTAVTYRQSDCGDAQRAQLKQYHADLAGYTLV